jgi:methionine-rich copper-binding protein CopC
MATPDMRIKLRAATALLAMVVAASLLAGIAQAHADYARSEPGAEAVVAAAPARVVIWFTQDMFRRQGENWIHVTGPTGEDVHSGEAVIDDDDRRQMSVDLLPELPPGVYTVAWHTLSAEDGDDHDGSFTFTLDPEAQVTSTPMIGAPTPTALPATAAPTVAPTSTTPAASRPGVACGAALAPGMGLVVLAAGLRRRPRSRQ